MSTIQERASKTAQRLYQMLELSVSGEKAAAVHQAIEEALVEAKLEERENCASVAMGSSVKAAADIREGAEALIANLSSLR